MNHWMRWLLPAIALHAMLAGCQTGPAEGEYVTFVRDLMAESAHLEEAAGEGPGRAEEAERAVRAWRGQGEAEEDSSVAGQGGGLSGLGSAQAGPR